MARDRYPTNQIEIAVKICWIQCRKEMWNIRNLLIPVIDTQLASLGIWPARKNVKQQIRFLKWNQGNEAH